MVRLDGLGARKPGAALGRPAPARRARPGDRQPPARPAARRAARRAGPQAAPGDAGRAQAHPARGRHHVRLRDPRPGGGADDERPPRRVQRRAHRAGRRAGRGLRAPGQRRSSPASSASRTCSSATGGASRSAPRRCACSPTARTPARCTSRAAPSATSPTRGWSRATRSSSTRAASFRWSGRTSRPPRRRPGQRGDAGTGGVARAAGRGHRRWENP